MGTSDSLNDGQQQVPAATGEQDGEAAAGTELEDEEYDHDEDLDRLWRSGPASSDPLSPRGVFGEPHWRRMTPPDTPVTRGDGSMSADEWKKIARNVGDAARAVRVAFETSETRGAGYFTRAEAEAQVGRRYRASGGYSGVPSGTAGRVSGVYEVAGRGFGVDVTWEGIPGGSPLDSDRGGLTDGFSRAELFLVLPRGPLAGRRAMEPIDGPDGGPDVPSAEGRSGMYRRLRRPSAGDLGL